MYESSQQQLCIPMLAALTIHDSTASAPVDNVLQASGIGFLSGLYPPVGPTLGSQSLRNGTVVESPLNGFQLIPLQVVQSGAGSEDSAWLQGATNCANAQSKMPRIESFEP
jgi:hypothetical protein